LSTVAAAAQSGRSHGPLLHVEVEEAGPIHDLYNDALRLAASLEFDTSSGSRKAGDMAAGAAEGAASSASSPLSFGGLRDAVQSLLAAATALDAKLADAAFTDSLAGSELALRRVNDRLHLAERSFLFLQGIVGREWLRNLIWVRCEPTLSLRA
jgi:hypothetical protein